MKPKQTKFEREIRDSFKSFFFEHMGRLPTQADRALRREIKERISR
jgi:hypothetical protein